MKRYLQKGEVGTIIALSVLVIIGISTLVSSTFLSQRQINNSKASNSCTSVISCSQCQGSNKECKTVPNSGGTEWECCDKIVSTPTPTIKPPTSIPTPSPTSIVDPTEQPTSPPKKCDKTGRYNVGKCGENTCSPDMIFKCDWYTKDSQGTCGGNKCKCEPDASCITPTPTPTDVPADTTDLGIRSGDQTGMAYCPDGGIPESNGASCDYGRQSAGNSVYIDKDNPDDCRKCIWVNYGGSFPYGQCHYANSSVCRRSDNVGGCAGVCNSTCCSDNSPKENGDVYDQGNVPGSSGIVSPDTGAVGEQLTIQEDTTFQGATMCGDDGRNYVINQDGTLLDIGPCS